MQPTHNKSESVFTDIEAAGQSVCEGMASGKQPFQPKPSNSKNLPSNASLKLSQRGASRGRLSNEKPAVSLSQMGRVASQVEKTHEH
jgi:hypothetical protein